MKFNPAKISELREKHDLSLYEFGKQLQTNKQRVHQWEVGITKPNMAALEKLCNTFKVKPGYFFTSN